MWFDLRPKEEPPWLMHPPWVELGQCPRSDLGVLIHIRKGGMDLNLVSIHPWGGLLQAPAKPAKV